MPVLDTSQESLHTLHAEPRGALRQLLTPLVVFIFQGLPRHHVRLRVASYKSCRASRCTQATYESTLSPTHLMQQLLAFVHPLLKSVPDLSKETLGKLDLAKVPRLPRNLYVTFRKCCACHAIQTLGKLDLAKVLRLQRNLNLTLRKCCACHAIQTWRNLRVAVPMGPRSEHGPNALRTRSERGPNALRPGAANRLAFGSPETPIHARGHAFCSFLYSHHTRAHIFSRAYSFSSSVSERASFQLVAVTRKFLLNFL